MRTALIAVLVLALAAFAVAPTAAQPAPVQAVMTSIVVPGATTYSPTSASLSIIDLSRFVGGAWEIHAAFADTASADSAALEFFVQCNSNTAAINQWKNYDTDNSNGKLDGFLCTSMDSVDLVRTNASGLSYNLTPIASGPNYPWKTSSLVYECQSNANFDQANRTKSHPSNAHLYDDWVVPFSDAFGNDQPLGPTRLIVVNRHPRISATVTVVARGRRGY